MDDTLSNRCSSAELDSCAQEDENGNIVREKIKDTDVIAQYKTMRETLVFLTHLNCDDTESIMLSKLTEQLETLPSLCRFQLQQVASYVLSLFEPSAQLYQQAPISADLRRAPQSSADLPSTSRRRSPLTSADLR